MIILQSTIHRNRSLFTQVYTNVHVSSDRKSETGSRILWSTFCSPTCSLQCVSLWKVSIFIHDWSDNQIGLLNLTYFSSLLVFLFTFHAIWVLNRCHKSWRWFWWSWMPLTFWPWPEQYGLHIITALFLIYYFFKLTIQVRKLCPLNETREMA